VSGSDSTRKAAIRTRGIPPTASPIAGPRLYLLRAMKRRPPTGMKKAQEPIMIGNAALGFIPRRLTRIMQGA
jgi:hypothetical protein